jgi:hypothetical protein
MSIAAALLNENTSIIEGVIAVNSLEDVVPTGYKLLEIPKYKAFADEEEKELYEILKEIDPDFENPDILLRDIEIHPWVTKWTREKGFHV